MWRGTHQTNGATANANFRRAVSHTLIAFVTFRLLILCCLQAPSPWLASNFRSNTRFSASMVSHTIQNIHEFLPCNCFYRYFCLLGVYSCVTVLQPQPFAGSFGTNLNNFSFPNNFSNNFAVNHSGGFANLGNPQMYPSDSGEEL